MHLKLLSTTTILRHVPHRLEYFPIVLQFQYPSQEEISIPDT